MKLYPIIYLNEAARSASEALDKGIAVLGIQVDAASPFRIALFSKERARQAIENKKDLNLGRRAIVGTVSYMPQARERNLFRVTTSAGVNKFGPLAYQIAMYAIRSYWLRSDSNLTEGEGSSSKVWNQMYARPETYERKWLGDFNTGLSILSYALKATDLGHNVFRGYDLNEFTKTESEVEKYLQEKNHSMAEFGHLYAYRLIQVDPDIQKLFDSGEAFLDDMENRGYDVSEIYKSMNFGISGFFARRYK